MTSDRGLHTMLGVCTAILTVAALYLTRPILAPVACALFVIAVVWPCQRALQRWMPKLAALALTLLATIVVFIALGSLVVWGFGQAGQWLIGNAARFQTLYIEATGWLELHGVYAGNLLVENFNVAWVIGTVRDLSVRLQSLVSFALVALVFTMLGLLEVDLARQKLASLGNQEAGRTLLRAGEQIAGKFQRYMLVRSLMSVLTGLVVWGVASLAGLELARAWGVIAFALNYIPFIGPLVATVFPTLFALAQFESWQMAVVILSCLNLSQFLLGSYLEPRVAGAALSLSPFMVLFAVFFWSFLWGIPGAFIGVPIMIALHTLCEQHRSGHWLALALSGRPGAPGRD